MLYRVMGDEACRSRLIGEEGRAEPTPKTHRPTSTPTSCSDRNSRPPSRPQSGRWGLYAASSR